VMEDPPETIKEEEEAGEGEEAAASSGEYKAEEEY